MPEPTRTTTATGHGEAASATALAPQPSVRTRKASGKSRSLWTDAWYDLRRSPLFLMSAALILMFLAMAIRPQLFTGVDPYARGACNLSNSVKPPSAAHWFGFDVQGCDVYARTIYGARASITVGVFTTIGATLLGGLIGTLAGYFGRWADALLSRITDIFLGLPLVLGALVFMAAFPKRTIWIVILALIVLGWTQIARISRGSVMTVKEADYVVAARALGARHSRIILRHILPNSVAPVIVVATISLGIFIVTEATLSFLGLGLPTTIISWGGDISTASVRLRTAPHALLFPAGMLSVAVLSFIMLGDAVRDALDPKLR